GLLQTVGRALVPIEPALQVGLICLGAYLNGLLQSRVLLRSERDLDLLCNRPSHFALQTQAIAQVTVIAFGPKLGLVSSVDELGCDPHTVVRPADAALDDVIDPEFTPDARDGPIYVLVVHCGRACDHAELLRIDPPELGNHLFRQPIAE